MVIVSNLMKKGFCCIETTRTLHEIMASRRNNNNLQLLFWLISNSFTIFYIKDKKDIGLV